MIGLIFGETDFPKYIYKKIRNKKKYTIIDLTNKNYFKNDRNSHKVSIGQFGKIISILRGKNCKKVLFAGKINKPNLIIPHPRLHIRKFVIKPICDINPVWRHPILKIKAINLLKVLANQKIFNIHLPYG